MLRSPRRAAILPLGVEPRTVKILIAVCLVIVAIVGAPWDLGGSTAKSQGARDSSFAGLPLYGTIYMSKDNPGNALDDFRFGSISPGIDQEAPDVPPATRACGGSRTPGPVPYPPISNGKLPVFPVVDNFNRPDEGPPPGTGWVNKTTGSSQRAKVRNNQLVPDPTSSGKYGFAGYHGESGVPPVAVGFTITSRARAWDDYLELSLTDQPAAAERTYFEIGFFNRHNWGADSGWQLYRSTPSGEGVIGYQDHIDPWAIGDRVALTYDGTSVAAWRMKVGTCNWIKLEEPPPENNTGL